MHFLRLARFVTRSSCSWLARNTDPIPTVPRGLTGLWALAYHTPLPEPVTLSILLSTTFGCRMLRGWPTLISALRDGNRTNMCRWVIQGYGAFEGLGLCARTRDIALLWS